MDALYKSPNLPYSLSLFPHLFTMVTMAGSGILASDQTNPCKSVSDYDRTFLLRFPPHTWIHMDTRHKTTDKWHKTQNGQNPASQSLIIIASSYFDLLHICHTQIHIDTFLIEICPVIHISFSQPFPVRRRFETTPFELGIFRRSGIAREWEIRRSLFKWNCGRRLKRETRRKFIAD